MNINAYFSNDTLTQHKIVMKELIARDKNHPSVVMWSLANEPCCYCPLARSYFQSLADYTRSIDPTSRPITVVQAQSNFSIPACTVVSDIISLNKYYAWYTDPGALELIQRQLDYDFSNYVALYKKPIMVTEYGAGAVEGFHSEFNIMWNEEYQKDFLSNYFASFDKFRQYLIGEFVWTFTDFVTGDNGNPPGDRRVGEFNKKGMFTRQRKPKSSAFLLRSRYAALKEKQDLQDNNHYLLVQ